VNEELGSPKDVPTGSWRATKTEAVRLHRNESGDTLDVYGHVREETRAAAAGRLSRLLFPPARAAKPAGRETAHRKSA
jgi:hypothetical protein